MKERMADLTNDLANAVLQKRKLEVELKRWKDPWELIEYHAKLEAENGTLKRQIETDVGDASYAIHQLRTRNAQLEAEVSLKADYIKRLEAKLRRSDDGTRKARR